MQNEPQLLVEMEELREEIEEITYSIAGFESSGGEIGMGAEEATNKILKMLATALEEQRAKDIKIVETVISEWEEAGLPETQVALHDALGRLKEDTHAQ